MMRYSQLPFVAGTGGYSSPNQLLSGRAAGDKALGRACHTGLGSNQAWP